MHHERKPTRSERQSRQGNPNWKGGRSVASNGYVLIRVGTDHPLADVRGYAYEHRLVASRKIGRWLVPGEQVHHIDGDKLNNDPSNLEVCAGAAEHLVHHRKSDSDRRLPGELNPDVQCECGCGETFPLFDHMNRPRRFVSGHNPRSSPTCDAVLDFLSNNGNSSPASIADGIGIHCQLVKTTLWKLQQKCLVKRIGRAQWVKTGG